MLGVRLFEIFADAGSQPLVVHCTAGKDRTGVTTALLLSVLGVERDLIVVDYRQTNRDVARQADFIEATTGLPEGMDREALLRAAGVPNEAIGDFLAGLDERYGGPLGFLCSIGIRSLGRDGEEDTGTYTAGNFPVTNYDCDIVWVDGYFVRSPGGSGSGGEEKCSR